MPKSISVILLEFLERKRTLNRREYYEYTPALNLLRAHGFPKELDKEVVEILKRLVEESRYAGYSVKEAGKDLEKLLRKWQKGGKNALAAKKTF